MGFREKEMLIDLKGGGWISRETWNRLCKPLLVVANAGANCDMFDGPLKVIVQSKKRTHILVH